jgi:DNA repair exonuclease SbcCD ATPase subunit
MKMRHISFAVMLAIFAIGGRLPAGGPQEAESKELAERVQRLEKQVKELEELLRPMKSELQARGRATALRKKYTERMGKDLKTYSQDELREIETLYQVANKQWNSPAAQESLKKLTGKYDKANRTGCALLYLGQMSGGDDKEKYLTKAIEDFGDCWYGDGVQVGAYARLQLAAYYAQQGKKEEAKRLFGEIREKYPDAVDHSGNLLIEAIPK